MSARLPAEVAPARGDAVCPDCGARVLWGGGRDGVGYGHCSRSSAVSRPSASSAYGDGACQWRGSVLIDERGRTTASEGRPAVQAAIERLQELKELRWRWYSGEQPVPRLLAACLDAALADASAALRAELARPFSG